MKWCPDCGRTWDKRFTLRPVKRQICPECKAEGADREPRDEEGKT